MKWSPQQDDALQAVSKWLKDKHGKQVFRLFGYAGTGKSTLATHLAKDVGKVCFAAFTGKAALVMRNRGCEGATTIHGLIYSPDDDGSEEANFKLNWSSKAKDADLIVIDEVSMVGEELGRDLEQFGTKILVLGDPGQLRPVGDEVGYFTSQKPDVMLTEIHRQAADNPIIRLSIDIRNNKPLEYGTYGTSKIIRRPEVDRKELMAADQLIVGLNKTRQSFNARVRELLKLDPDMPVKGDKIICLRNNREKRLLNGQIWFVDEVAPGRNGKLGLAIHAEGSRAGKDLTSIKTHLDFFNGKEAEMPWKDKRNYEEFTYGYAITGHKAQGSQWPNVYLFDESSSFREDRKNWLYTAVTRAADRITIVR